MLRISQWFATSGIMFRVATGGMEVFLAIAALCPPAEDPVVCHAHASVFVNDFFQVTIMRLPQATLAFHWRSTVAKVNFIKFTMYLLVTPIPRSQPLETRSSLQDQQIPIIGNYTIFSTLIANPFTSSLVTKFS